MKGLFIAVVQVRRRVIKVMRCIVAGSDVSVAGTANLHQAMEECVLRRPFISTSPAPVRSVNTAVLVEVVVVKADVDGLLHAPGVPVLFTVDTPHIVPIRPVTSSPSMLSYCRSVHTGESHVTLMLLDPLTDGPAGFTDVDLVALATWNLVDDTSTSSRGDRVLWVDELVPQGGRRAKLSMDAVFFEDSTHLSGDTVHEEEYSEGLVLNPLCIGVHLWS